MNAPESHKRILVYIGPYGDDAIGENLIKLPFLRGIAKAYPGGEITWIHGSGPLKFQSILEPLVRGINLTTMPDTVLENTWTAALNPSRLLGGHHFDVIIDTQKNPKHTLALRRIPHDVFISSAWRFVFSSRRPKDGGGRLRACTLSERLLQLLELATDQPQEIDHRAILPDEYKRAAEQALPPGLEYVGLAPGAGRQDTGKCWPLDNFIALAKDQIKKRRQPVFFLGPEEGDWHDIITGEIPDAHFAPLKFATLGGPTFCIALGGRLAVGVANCSGTGHMLAAGGAAMVSLYGPTSPEKFAPYTPNITTIRAQAFGGSDIALIPVEAVAEGVDGRVSG